MTRNFVRRLARVEDAAARVHAAAEHPRTVFGYLGPFGAVPDTLQETVAGLAEQRTRMTERPVSAETMTALTAIAEELLALPPPHPSAESIGLLRRAMVESLPGSPAQERCLVPGKDGPVVINIVREKDWRGGAGEA